ncbi:protein strawberry notch homolog 1-like [Pollicipes pollicipes]|uniref:protein strawberry notch homolog 1-like n=1 Tax=Pollicipes pollicipes TaxID=41117 RepID=UPI00188517A4|nr:protein strawberry notch homolog 1-like [Pollicipes pollicipes]
MSAAAMMNPMLVQTMAAQMAQMGLPPMSLGQIQQLLLQQMGMSQKMPPNMWMNDYKMGMPQEDEAGEEDDEDMGVAETYADYMPSKLKLGRKHPDPVVETASLASVAPTDVWYDLSFPEEVISQGKLSALQLEAITYTCQQHSQFLKDGCRAGFLIGDGAGVGKGRTIAGLIYENYLKGRKKAIWVSVSNDLKYDSERDLGDIGAGRISVHSLNKLKYAKINSPVNGDIKKGVIYSTYSSLIGESSTVGGKYKTRLKQLLNWCGEDFDGLIVFDECHRAKNLCPVGSSKPTKTGLTVLELQKQLPKARVVYASATGASEPKNMAYMVRLGIWGEGTPFAAFSDFISAVEKRGVGAMEIVAMDMKLRGSYMARQLSFHGTSFRIDEVMLTPEFTKMYDESVQLWVEAREKFQRAAELIDAEKTLKKSMWGQFWSAHQRFFKYLCIGAKVKHVVNTASNAIKMGKCVVIGMQSTGEARTLEQLERDEGELTDFVSTAKGVIQSLIEKHFPAPDRDRINRLLGLKPDKPSPEFQQILDEMKSEAAAPSAGSSGGSSGKRKPVRQAARKAIKRYKGASSGSESDSDVSRNGRRNNGSGRGADSDYKMSGSSDDEDEEEGEAEDSDSDVQSADMTDDEEEWGGGRKRKAAKPKKPPPKDKFAYMTVGNRAADGEYHPPSRSAVEMACLMKDELLSKMEKLGDRLPANTLDELIDQLGGPENVAEMTGRKGRVVQNDDGQIAYESRSEQDIPLETLNLTEKRRFMDGEKDIAIISEAASSGISLQSDRRVKNQRRRVHITLELPWSADRAIQQFGRTHRSNQVNAPEYVFLISELAGERRFASIVAKRLESLGALTHGDRRATESRDLSRFNIDNKYGRSALEATMKTVMGYEQPLVPPPDDYKGNFFLDVKRALVGVGLIAHEQRVYMLDKDFNNMSKFLNRILGMPVDLQNRLFKYFTDTLSAIVAQAKKTGRYDMGILDLGSQEGSVRRTKLRVYLHKHATGTGRTELHTVHVERGCSWKEAQDKCAELEGSDEGFYVSHQIRNGKLTAMLAVLADPGSKLKQLKKDEQLFTVCRPNTGVQIRMETLAEIKKKYKRVQPDEAERHWQEQYDASVTTCSHAYWRGVCKRRGVGVDCDVGRRARTYHVLSGSVLHVWTRVEGVLSSANVSQAQQKMQVIRVRCSDQLKIVGIVVPNHVVPSLVEMLEEAADSHFVENLDKD